MTLKEALKGGIPCLTHSGNRGKYEVVIFDQRKGNYKLGKLNADGEFLWMGLPYSKFDELKVYDWNHTNRTMLIVL